MIRTFLDTSVLFAATLSSTGASREIVRLGLENKLTLVLSEYVIRGMRQALARKAPTSLSDIEDFLRGLSYESVEPTRQEVLAAAEYTDLKDAPIVAVAVKAGLDYLVSLDKRHLIGQPEVASGSGLTILLPGDLLQFLRSDQ